MDDVHMQRIGFEFRMLADAVSSDSHDGSCTR